MPSESLKACLLPKISIFNLRGIRERENGEGKGGGIIPGKRLFQIFRSKGGDYWREAINRGTTTTRGNTVFCRFLSLCLHALALK